MFGRMAATSFWHHPDEAGEYIWEISPFELAPAPIPPRWLERLRSASHAATDRSGRAQYPRRYPQRDLFRHASRLRSQGYTEEEIEQFLITLNDSRCQPPLEPDELAKIAASAARYDVERAIEPRPQSEECACWS
jgi:hypothetical protein